METYILCKKEIRNTTKHIKFKNIGTARDNPLNGLHLSLPTR